MRAVRLLQEDQSSNAALCGQLMRADNALIDPGLSGIARIGSPKRRSVYCFCGPAERLYADGDIRLWR